MSNTLLNVHILLGEPCGKDATLNEIADWIGKQILDNVLIQRELKMSILHEILTERK